MKLSEIVKAPGLSDKSDPVERMRLAIAELAARGDSFELIALRDHLNWILMWRKDQAANSQRQPWNHQHSASSGVNTECTGFVHSQLYYWESGRTASAVNFDRAFYVHRDATPSSGFSIYFQAWRHMQGPTHAELKFDGPAAQSLLAGLGNRTSI